MASQGGGAAKAESMEEVTKLLEKTLLPDILNQSEHAQKELDDMMAAFKACEAPSFDLAPLKNVSDARGPIKAAHDKCRGLQNQAYNDEQVCEGQLAALKSAMDAACGAVEAVKRDPGDAAGQCKPAAGMVYEDWLDVNAHWFAKKAKEFKGLQKACDEAAGAYKAQVPVCAGKKSAVLNKKEACNVQQSDLEDSYCKVESALVEGCTDYSECYKVAMEEYNNRVPVIKAEEKARKINWRVFKRIACLLPVLKAGGKAADIEACKKKTHETKHLDLKYQDAPPQELCPGAGPMPCAADFKRAVYGGLPEHGVAAECKPCPGAAPLVFAGFVPGERSGKEICAGDTVYEYTQKWDCASNDITKFQVPRVGQVGWRGAFEKCAAECAQRDNCAAFNYPRGANRKDCYLKFGDRRQSESRGWECGKVQSMWSYFTKIPGQKCKSPPVVALAWSLPAGILNNYAIAKLPESWKVFSDHSYGFASSLGNVMPNQGDCMLWGAKNSKDAQDFVVVAFGRRSVIATAGGGVWENGAYWYAVNRKSFGFADNNRLSLNICDTMDGNSNKRLCWHNLKPHGGWRAGSKRGLNSDKVWRKVVMYGPCEVK
jgi:hypothetical protein